MQCCIRGVTALVLIHPLVRFLQDLIDRAAALGRSIDTPDREQMYGVRCMGSGLAITHSFFFAVRPRVFVPAG